jgi:hypothetical protein
MGESVLSPELAERLAMAACENGKDWLEVHSDVDLALTSIIVRDTLFAALYDQYEEYRAEVSAKNNDRADIQLHSLAEHLRYQSLVLGDVLEKHRTLGRESLAKATEGRIQALQNRVGLRRMKIENSRTLSSEYNEVALSIIRIEP